MLGSREIHSASDARRLARRRLPWMIFDYIDGAAGEEQAVARNRAALDAAVLPPRILKDVSTRRLTKPLFGRTMGRPFGIAPMAMGNLAWPGADMMLARLAARLDIPLGISTASSTPLEALHAAAGGQAWFQLYFSGDGTSGFKLAQRARDAGIEVLVLTVDVPALGRRPRELRHGFKMPFRIGPRQFIDFAVHPHWSLSTLAHGRPQMANALKPGYAFDRTESRAKATWDTLARLRDLWPGHLVVKGVLDADDAVALKAAGVDAVQISSHGGRQLEGAPAPFGMIGPLRDALGTEMPLLYDSGIRSGEDILKALRAGADFVFLGRILLFAIAAGGERGLDQLIDALTEELSIAMALCGQTDLT